MVASKEKQIKVESQQFVDLASFLSFNSALATVVCRPAKGLEHSTPVKCRQTFCNQWRLTIHTAVAFYLPGDRTRRLLGKRAIYLFHRLILTGGVFIVLTYFTIALFTSLACFSYHNILCWAVRSVPSKVSCHEADLTSSGDSSPSGGT